MTMGDKVLDLINYAVNMALGYVVLRVFLTGFIACCFECEFSEKEILVTFLVVYAIYKIFTKIIEISAKKKK